MSHYEARLQADATQLRERVLGVARAARDAVHDAVQALLHGDRERSYQVILGDLRINREIRAIDRMCHAFVARHLPAARHLRFVSSVMRLDIALERIGDYAVSVSRNAVQLGSPPPAVLARGIELIADQAVGMLDQAIEAFAEGNAELARGTKSIATQVDHTFDNLLEDLVQTETGRPVREVISLVAIINKLERVSDQAKNICEEVVFIVTGQTKPPKRYRVLFVDAADDGATHVAAGLARKHFDLACEAATAGWAPASAVRADVVQSPRLALDLSAASTTDVASFGHELGDFHVICCLGGDLVAHLEAVPFQSILLRWDVPALPPQGAEGLDDALDELCRDLMGRLERLVEALRGPLWAEG